MKMAFTQMDRMRELLRRPRFIAIVVSNVIVRIQYLQIR